MNPTDDKLTLEKLRRGDAVEFERVFRATYAPLCRFVSRYVEPAVAEEIAQETYLRLWNDRERLDVRTSLRAYLFAAARNRALNHLKHLGVEQRWAEAETAASGGAHAEADAPERLDRAEVAQRVGRVVEGLPPRLRETVDLRWGEGLTHAEIAEAMGVTVKAVEANVARAKAALRAGLGGLVD
jgi:RNA polymerase sigma-70 factor, ECF subfamily